jgi:flagellar hook-associated protein 1 FlgK
MSVSTFMGLQTALRGLLAHQRSIETTSHNIANANTVGYTRQEAVIETTPAFSYPGVNRNAQPGQIGTGVDIKEYRRIRDQFVDIQLRAQTMRSGYAEAKKDGLSQVELALAEPGDTGLNALLSQYWSAWHDVSNAPENVATRQALAQAASSLGNAFQNLSGQLDTISSQTDQAVAMSVDDVNSIAGQIAKLTETIVRTKTVGDQPNDLLDQRDVLIDKLSALGNVSITEGSLGSVDVSFGGVTLVAGSTANTFQENGADFEIVDAATSTATTATLASGKLAGLDELRDTTIPGYVSQLNAIASALITATNNLQGTGYDLSGTLGSANASAGTFFTGTDATDIAVNPALVASPSLIAASSDGTAGNAENALAMVDLRNQALVGGSTIDSAYSQLVTQVGSDSQEAQRTYDNANVLTTSLQNRRQSISGVSLDEEMTNLLRFQRGYQASARALNAMDGMIDLLINRVGAAGL